MHNAGTFTMQKKLGRSQKRQLKSLIELVRGKNFLNELKDQQRNNLEKMQYKNCEFINCTAKTKSVKQTEFWRLCKKHYIIVKYPHKIDELKWRKFKKV